MRKVKYDRFEPCEHVGCLNHKSHPCEGCGRIGGNGTVLNNDVLLDEFKIDLLRSVCKMVPMIVIYENTSDYPNRFVARMFDANNPTVYIIVKDSLEDIRGVIPEGMFIFKRHENDDNVIVETYM